MTTTTIDLCLTCIDGCDCETGTPGCEHYGCWGTNPTGTCPSVDILRTATRAQLA